MFQLRYEPIGNIGRYVLQNDGIESEENILTDSLVSACQTYNQLSDNIDRHGFPDLCPTDWMNPDTVYPLYTLAPYTVLREVDVPCDKLVGGNWANQPRKYFPSYPSPGKVRSLLTANLNINEIGEDTCSKIEPIEVYKIFDHYFNVEGNHRLYVRRLMGAATIRAIIIEINYIWLL